VFFGVLADRNGKPGAVLFQAGPGDEAGLAGLLDSDALRGLAAETPALFLEGDPAGAALDAAGLRALAPFALHIAKEQFNPATLPPPVQWVAGDWCLAPPPKALGPQAASRALALQLVQLVANDADTHEIEALLRQDPTLSYHLLRLVNSLGMGMSRRVTSFSQAILILGRAQLRRWLNLMLFAARQGDQRSGMLLARVAVRARGIELLAKAAGMDRTTQDQGFMTGMFSLLGVLFGMPLAEVLAPLAIGEAVQQALLERAGELGALLDLMEQAERGDFAKVGARLAELQIGAADYNLAMAEATRWMLGTVREAQGA